MPSRARPVRTRLERGARIGALALLAWALWLAMRPLAVTSETVVVGTGDLAGRLREWARGAAPDSLHVEVGVVPDDTVRDWLVAQRRAGTPTSWSGDVAPLALAVEPVNAPAGGSRLLIAAPPDAAIALRDAAGPLDTLRATSAGAAYRTPTVAEPVQAVVMGTPAWAVAADSLAPGPVLVLGTAGWEARYVVAALEESGWTVDARLTIAPGLTVRRGAPGAIDTSRYAAVIVLDSAAAGDGRRLAAFARRGGGLVLSGVAASLPGIRDIAPGRPGARVRPAILSFTSSSPRRALGFVSISRLRTDALVLESRDRQPVVAARRSGLGRVVQIGYDESWRWRMQGGEAGPAAHRRWWSDAVATAARRTATPRQSSGMRDGAAAPRATLVAALGPPTARTTERARTPVRGGPHPWLLVAIAALLLAEWGSRRLRGAA